MADRGTIRNPDIPKGAIIGTFQPLVGESFAAAVGVCQCNESRDLSRGKFWLRAGEQWVCPECGRVYSFNGERIDVTEL